MRMLATLLLIAPLTALAADGVVPLQGYLTAADGTPLNHTVPVTFTLYNDAQLGGWFYEDTLDVAVHDGAFSVGLGSGDVALDLVNFASYPAAHLVLGVGDDPDMAAVPLGHVPYAAHAQTASTTALFDGHSLADLLDSIPSQSDIEDYTAGVSYTSEADLLAALEDDVLLASSPAGAIASADLASLAAVAANADGWDTAASWGDHRAAGYLRDTTDPLFRASPAAALDSADLSLIRQVSNRVWRWEEAVGWGDHGLAGYLTSETDPVFSASVAAGMDSEHLSALQALSGQGASGWDEGVSYGDHSEEGYLKVANVRSLSPPLSLRYPFASGEEFVLVGGETIPAHDPPLSCALVVTMTHQACPLSGPCDSSFRVDWMPVVRPVGEVVGTPIDGSFLSSALRSLPSQRVVVVEGDRLQEMEIGCQVFAPAQTPVALVTCRVAMLCVQ